MSDVISLEKLRYTIAPPGGPIAWRDYVDFSCYQRQEDGTLLQGTISACYWDLNCEVDFTWQVLRRCPCFLVRFGGRTSSLVPWET